MISKKQFMAQAEAAIANYPVAAQFYQAKDPRILAQIEAMASMLSLFSESLDVQAAEPFTKARDVTVLADAAIKGILPFGTPKQASVKIVNATAVAFNVLTGRKLQDQRGREYTVSIGATIPASGQNFVTAVQEVENEFEHTVSEYIPFYGIQIPKPETGYVSRVRLIDSASNEFTYFTDFLNVDVGDEVFHLETDENQELFIRFGVVDVAGYQPAANEVFTVIYYVTEGAFDIDVGANFFFETSISPSELGAKLTLEQVLAAGSNPMDIATMREIANYPSIYDNSAVFLNNFDFLVRRNLSPIDFLAVWNEFVEEGVRGSNVDNINTLFVAAQKTGVLQSTLESQITQIIQAADDSYKIQFVPIVIEQIQILINAQISPVYDDAAVEQEIKELLVDAYGQDSAFSKRGSARIKYRDFYNLLTSQIQAFQGDQAGDLQVSIIYTGNDDGELKTNKAYSRTGAVAEVTFTAHNFAIGDYVTISDASDVTLNDFVQITAVTPNTFEFNTDASGSLVGTCSVRALPKPEKWRYVTNASITVSIG